ncbi:hypothetical protein D3C81_315230 [compost metagenome]
MEHPFKYRISLAIIGAVFCVPTSYYGYLWFSTKLAKQSLNCIEDAYKADYSSQAAANTAAAAVENCRKGIDPQKGMIEFLKDERKRTDQ